MQQVLQAGAHGKLEIFQLLGCLVLDNFGRAFEEPTLVLVVGLNRALATAAEFGALAIRIQDVIDEPDRNPRHPVAVISYEATTRYRLNVEIAVAANGLKRSLHDLRSFVVERRRRFFNLSTGAYPDCQNCECKVENRKGPHRFGLLDWRGR